MLLLRCHSLIKKKVLFCRDSSLWPHSCEVSLPSHDSLNECSEIFPLIGLVGMYSTEVRDSLLLWLRNRLSDMLSVIGK